MRRNCAVRIGRVERTLSISILVALVLAGCVNGTADRSVLDKPEAVPYINLLTPRAGQALSSDEVEVQVEIE